MSLEYLGEKKKKKPNKIKEKRGTIYTYKVLEESQL